jgi:hypothetical protein
MSISEDYTYNVKLFLKKMLKKLTKSRKRPNDVLALRDLIQKFDRAVHFIMPDEGIEFEDNVLDESDFDKTPFPLLTIETVRRVNDNPNTPSIIFVERYKKELFIKRHLQGLIQFNTLDALKSTSSEWVIHQISFIYDEEDSTWFCHPVSIINIIDEQFKYSTLKSDPQSPPNKSHRITHPLFSDQLKEISASLNALEQKKYIDDMLHNHAIDRCLYLNFLQAALCQNVVIESVEPTVDSQKKGRVRSKTPPPSYVRKILTLDIPPTRVEQAHQGGTHRSPRPHLRRGHVRTYKSGKRVWVEAMHINKDKEGFVEKSYALRNAS